MRLIGTNEKLKQLDFKMILMKVKPDFRACEKATSIANNCFLELTKFIKNTYGQ